jgi:hypothetical protein
MLCYGPTYLPKTKNQEVLGTTSRSRTVVVPVEPLLTALYPHLRSLSDSPPRMLTQGCGQGDKARLMLQSLVRPAYKA